MVEARIRDGAIRIGLGMRTGVSREMKFSRLL